MQCKCASLVYIKQHNSVAEIDSMEDAMPLSYIDHGCSSSHSFDSHSIFIPFLIHFIFISFYLHLISFLQYI